MSILCILPFSCSLDEEARSEMEKKNYMNNAKEAKDVLLGVSSDNAQGRYKIKIYDVNKQQWVAGFNGQWAVWEKPSKGIYWTHFELYTSNGKLVETKTYAFGV